MTIASISTAPGIGAIALVRVSGVQSFPIVNQLVKPSAHFMDLAPNTAKFTGIYDGPTLIDQVVVVKFAAPHSYTGEDMVEISCHGSRYIQQRILQLLLSHGCRMAEPGEFTMRAFMNGKMDLTQAEAVGDLIDSQSESSHHLAIHQLKGGFSRKINELREQFIHLAALMELELDFSEEDVEFADRTQMMHLLAELKTEVRRLTESFRLGNALKNGVPVAIIGQPNVGKSTLLNALLNDDRAIVSAIPGTTRDTIEDTVTIGGTLFRFIDTAGIRNSEDEIENFGIQRTYQTVDKADIVLYLVDAAVTTPEEAEAEIVALRSRPGGEDKHIVLVVNKIDTASADGFAAWDVCPCVCISAKERENVEAVGEMLTRHITAQNVGENTLLTNVRHYDILVKIADDITAIETGLSTHVPTDLVAIDVRAILDKLGRLTGTISDNDILNTVFGKFCIGK